MKDRRCLDGYFIRLEKRVLHLRYDYHLSYNESEERLGVEWPFTRLMRERLRWTGLRSKDAICYESLMFVPVGGARGRGCPRMRFYDTLKADLQAR